MEIVNAIVLKMLIGTMVVNVMQIILSLARLVFQSAMVKLLDKSYQENVNVSQMQS